MKVELTIADDRELRNAIRDLIKSEYHQGRCQ